LWAYAGNSPGNFVDSFGLMTTDELAALNRTVGWNSGAFEDTIGWNSEAFEDTVGWNPEAFGNTVNWNSDAFDRTIRLDLDKLWETTRLNLEAFHRTVDLDIPALNQTLGLTPWIMPVFDMSMAVQECQPKRSRKKMHLGGYLFEGEDPGNIDELLTRWKVERAKENRGEFEEWAEENPEEYQAWMEECARAQWEEMSPWILIGSTELSGQGGKAISTGRTIPNSLKEKLAMEEVMAKPMGTTSPRMPSMSDTKNNLLAADGWVKRVQNVNGVEIHYVENINTGKVLDFKFKD